MTTRRNAQRKIREPTSVLRDIFLTECWFAKKRSDKKNVSELIRNEFHLYLFPFFFFNAQPLLIGFLDIHLVVVV